MPWKVYLVLKLLTPASDFSTRLCSVLPMSDNDSASHSSDSEGHEGPDCIDDFEASHSAPNLSVAELQSQLESKALYLVVDGHPPIELSLPPALPGAYNE